MDTLYNEEETGLRVVGVDNGEVLLEPEQHGVLARITLVILVGGDCGHTCVDEESFTEELHWSRSATGLGFLHLLFGINA